MQSLTHIPIDKIKKMMFIIKEIAINRGLPTIRNNSFKVKIRRLVQKHSFSTIRILHFLELQPKNLITKKKC